MSSGKKRGRPEDTETKAAIEAIREKYPKFTRVQMSMVKNPEYGIQLSSGALSVLRDKNIRPPSQSRSAFVKKIHRAKQNRISIRLSDEDKVRFMLAKQQSGCKTVQEYLEKLIKENGNVYSEDQEKLQ